jgi:hypothetical protein
MDIHLLVKMIIQQEGANDEATTKRILARIEGAVTDEDQRKAEESARWDGFWELCDKLDSGSLSRSIWPY